jgi:hypothetical protein
LRVAFPPLDEHLVEPEITRDEIIGGRRVVAMSALEPHADQQSDLDYVLRAHAAPGYRTAADLLTRHDVAPLTALSPVQAFYGPPAFTVHEGTYRQHIDLRCPRGSALRRRTVVERMKGMSFWELPPGSPAEGEQPIHCD